MFIPSPDLLLMLLGYESILHHVQDTCAAARVCEVEPSLHFIGSLKVHELKSQPRILKVESSEQKSIYTRLFRDFSSLGKIQSHKGHKANVSIGELLSLCQHHNAERHMEDGRETSNKTGLSKCATRFWAETAHLYNAEITALNETPL